LINIDVKKENFVCKLLCKNKETCYRLSLNFKLQFSNFRLCKRQEIIKDDNDDLLKELFCFGRLAYSDDDEGNQESHRRRDEDRGKCQLYRYTKSFTIAC